MTLGEGAHLVRLLRRFDTRIAGAIPLRRHRWGPQERVTARMRALDVFHTRYRGTPPEIPDQRFQDRRELNRRARTFLHAPLAGGPQLCRLIRQQAAKRGLLLSVLLMAKRSLHVEVRTVNRQALWQLPAAISSSSDSGSLAGVASPLHTRCLRLPSRIKALIV